MGEEKIIIKAYEKKPEDEEEDDEDDYDNLDPERKRNLTREEFEERQKLNVKIEEKIVIKPYVFKDKSKSKPEEDEPEDKKKERRKVSDHFAEKEPKVRKEEERLIITPQVPSETEPEETVDDEQMPRNKVSDHFKEKEPKVKEEEDKIKIVPYDMDKDEPEDDDEEEEVEKKKKKLSRDDLKSARDVKVAIPTPDAAMPRRKKKEPSADDEIKNSLFDDMPKKEVKKAEEVPPPVEDDEEDEEEEEEEEEVKVEVQPKKKLSKQDLKPAVQIKAVFEPEEKTPRRKRKEPIATDEPAEKISIFDDIPSIEDVNASKEKINDHFPEKAKPLPVEESVVIAPTLLAEVESAPDSK